MSDLALLPPAIRSFVQGYVARGRRLALVRRLGAVLTLLLFWGLLWCGADRLLQLPASVRAAAMLGAATFAVAALAAPLRRWLAGGADWVSVAEEIEQQDPRFGQRLLTVTSRLMGRAEYRGSDEILEHLVYQVDREVSERRAATLLPIRSVAAPWLAAGLAVAAAVGLSVVPELGLPRLAARYALPWAALPPVTTASLSVYPGDRDVLQSSPLQIDVEAQRVEAGQVWLNVTDDGTVWSRMAMSPASVNSAGDGRFSCTLASIDRDLRYYVSGGDARSAQYTVRVLRRPAINEFRIRFSYPAYTGKAPLTVTNTDGVIEAPVGTEAEVTITATEPLQLALLTNSTGEKALMGRAGADNVRRGRLAVQRDGRYQVDMVSTRDVTGAAPPTAEIRAQPDRPPVIRLAEGGAMLRQSPRDILPLPYDAIDDYGIESVTLRVQNGPGQSIDLAVYPVTNAESASGSAVVSGPAAPSTRAERATRRVAGEFDFDLATVPLTMGDVVTLVMTAKDTGGQSTSTAPLQVLVSPKSIGSDAYDRLADLADASHLIDSLTDDLSRAVTASESLPPHETTAASSPEKIRRDRHLTAAIESAAMAPRALLRAAAHRAAPGLCIAIAGWVDDSQFISLRMEEIVRGPAAGPSAARESTDDIRHALQRSRELQSELKIVGDGERAAIILADRESMAQAEKRPVPPDGRGVERLKQTLQRARDEIAAGAKGIGLDANAPDFESQLHSKVAAADSFLSARHPVDFAAAARQWARQPSRQTLDHTRRDVLADRLSAAAEAEAVRSDADLVRAGDLQLASRAALKLAGEPTVRIDALADVLSALQKDHDLNRLPAGRDKRDDGPTRDAAARARQELVRMAGEDPSFNVVASQPVSPDTMPALAMARAEKAESQALQASAESARRHYTQSADIDRALFHNIGRLIAPDTAPVSAAETPSDRSDAQAAEQARVDGAARDVNRLMKTAAKLDSLSDGQVKLADQTRAAREETAPALSAGERELADQISRLTPASPVASTPPGAAPAALAGSDDPDWRDRAAAAMVAAQVQLASMPGQISQTLDAASDWRRLVERAKVAHRESDAAGADHQAAAKRAAQQADQDAADASRRLDLAAAPLAPSAGEALGALNAYAPETSASRTAIADALVPAMKSFAQALRNDAPEMAGRSAPALRQAVEACQMELARAQDELAQRDPLVAAKWFARSAADALGRKPPDFLFALSQQGLTAAALSRAWDLSIHHAAAVRLAQLPTLRALYAPEPIVADGSRLPAGARPGAGSGGGSGGALGVSSSPSMARDWRRLSPRDGDGAAATPHQADPAGYEAALRAYFEALGNVDGK